MPAVGPNGELYIIWEDYDPAPLGSLVKTAYSSNGGFSYVPDVTIDNTIITRGNANGFTPTSGTRYHIAAQPDRGILSVPSIAVDRSNGPHRGRIYAAFTEGGTGGGTNNTDIGIFWSDNNGQNWSPHTIVHEAVTNQASQFLPWLDVDDQSGAVVVAYYDTRNSPTNQLAELWASASVDGGATWAEAQIASVGSNESLSNPSRYGGNYLEYIGVSVRDGTIQAIWADNRNSASDLELYTASASIQSLTNTNVLSVVGDLAIDNTVIIRPSATNSQYLEVLVNGLREFTGLADSINTITITTGNGLDSIQVLDIPSFIQVSIRSGAGVDKIDIHNTGISTRPVAVDSGPGDDFLHVNTTGIGSSFVIPVGSDHFDLIEIGPAGTVFLLASGNLVIVTKTLSISATGTFDLHDNDLIVDYSGGSPATTVQGWINAAHRRVVDRFWPHQYGRENASPKNTTLGLLEGSQYIGLYGAGAAFDGETVDNTMVLVKYTYYGDTDFNGLINFDDYARTDSGFLNNRTGWFNGDFNGDGIINFDDYALIDLAFNTQTVVLRPVVEPMRIPKPVKLISRPN